MEFILIRNIRSLIIIFAGMVKDTFTDSRERSEMEAAFEKTLDPVAGSPVAGKSVGGIINLFFG